MKRTLISGTGMGLLAVAASAVLAGPKMRPVAKQDGSSFDRSWTVDVAQDGMAEVAAGQFMAAHGQDEAVRAFGKRMAIDHTKAGSLLKHIAGSEGVALPNRPAINDQKDYANLIQMAGIARDRAYMTHMVAGHVAAIALFKKEIVRGKEAQVRGFATNTLPTLQMHLKLAKIAAAKVGASTGRAPVKM